MFRAQATKKLAVRTGKFEGDLSVKGFPVLPVLSRLRQQLGGMGKAVLQLFHLLPFLGKAQETAERLARRNDGGFHRVRQFHPADLGARKRPVAQQKRWRLLIVQAQDGAFRSALQFYLALGFQNHQRNRRQLVLGAGFNLQNHIIDAAFTFTPRRESRDVQKSFRAVEARVDDGNTRSFQPLPAHLVVFHPREGKFHHFGKVSDPAALARVAVAQFAALANQALVRIVGVAVSRLPGERRVAEVNCGRGALALRARSLCPLPLARPGSMRWPESARSQPRRPSLARRLHRGGIYVVWIRSLFLLPQGRYEPISGLFTRSFWSS